MFGWCSAGACRNRMRSGERTLGAAESASRQISVSRARPYELMLLMAASCTCPSCTAGQPVLRRLSAWGKAKVRGRLSARPSAGAGCDCAAAAARGDAARRVRGRLQSVRRARAGRVRHRDERAGRTAARRGSGWLGLGRRSRGCLGNSRRRCAAGDPAGLVAGAWCVGRADLAARRRDRPRPACGRVGGGVNDRRARGSGTARPPERGRGNLEFNPFTPGRAVSGLVALVNRYVPVVVAAILDRRGLFVARGARDPHRVDADPLRHAPRARGGKRDVARELRQPARGVVLPRARARAACRQGAADLRAGAVGAGPPPRRLRALLGDALADPAPALHDADGVICRGRDALLRRRARGAGPCGSARGRLAARHRVRAAGRRDHRPCRAVLHGGRPRHRVRHVRVPGARLVRGEGRDAVRADPLGQPQRRRSARASRSGSRTSRSPTRARSAPCSTGSTSRSRPAVARDRRAERRRQDDADQAARRASTSRRRAASPSTASTSASSTSRAGGA